jgi:ribonuclease/clavin/mitogillin
MTHTRTNDKQAPSAAVFRTFFCVRPDPTISSLPQHLTVRSRNTSASGVQDFAQTRPIFSFLGCTPARDQCPRADGDDKAVDLSDGCLGSDEYSEKPTRPDERRRRRPVGPCDHRTPSTARLHRLWCSYDVAQNGARTESAAWAGRSVRTLVPAPAAGLVIRRQDGSVLLGRRTAQARSWPGTWAFPGGAVDDDDHALPLWTSTADATMRAARAAALREALEEAGLFLLCRADGSPASDDEVDIVRTGLLSFVGDGPPGPEAPGRRLHDVLRERELRLDDRGLAPLSSWTTMEGRYCVQRFLWSIDEKTRPVWRAPLTEELDTLGFCDPRALLGEWRAGRAFLLPQIRTVLERLAAVADKATLDDADVDVLAGAIDEPTRFRRDLSPSVVLLDAKTPTLWPATHTNTPVLGGGDVLLVDPATPYEDERERFDAALHTLLDGRNVRGIVLTHHHHDHVGDAARLRAKHRCPVLAHPLTKSRVEFDVDVLLNEGDVLDLPAGRGGPARHLVVLHTPGHAPGHICLWEPDLAFLVAGDMVAGIGSILIDPPEGHMNTYLRSLERLVSLAPRGLVPSHGPLIVDGTAKLQSQLAHRLARRAAVKNAIDAGAHDIASVVVLVHGVDTPEAMLPLAVRSVTAIVEGLREDGVVAGDDGRLALVG